MSNTEDVIPSQDKKLLEGKILALWERYKPILEHDYSRSRYILSVYAKTYAHTKIRVCISMSIIMSYSYNLSFLKEYNFVLNIFSIAIPLNITWQWF